MDLQLATKRVLVTGSTGGIGEAIALKFADAGAVVVVHGRREATAAAVVERIKQNGGQASMVLGDMAEASTVDNITSHIHDTLGAVDILINNVGLYTYKPWMETEEAEWRHMYETNVVATVGLVRRLVPMMKQAGWGRVINIGDGLAILPIPEMAAYSATKAAILNLSVNLVRELSGTEITVNAISPGAIKTPGVFDMLAPLIGVESETAKWDEIEQLIVEQIAPNPTGRMGTPDDIAHAALFLASPLAGYINGTNLRVDGGAVATVH